MSAEEKPENESGGLSNEPLPGSGAPSGQPPSPPEQPAEGQAQPPAEQPPAAPPSPPAPPAPAAAAAAPGAPVPAAATPGQPGTAIASLVCGLLGILLVWCCGFGGLLSIAAIITGVMAKGEVERRGAPSWMWITGLVTGIIGLVILLIWAIVVGINFSTNPNWDVETT